MTVFEESAPNKAFRRRPSGEHQNSKYVADFSSRAILDEPRSSGPEEISVYDAQRANHALVGVARFGLKEWFEKTLRAPTEGY